MAHELLLSAICRTDSVTRGRLYSVNLRPEMSLPVGTVPTVRDIFSYGMSLCSYTCPYRKGQTFGPKTMNRSCGLRALQVELPVRGQRRRSHRPHARVRPAARGELLPEADS